MVMSELHPLITERQQGIRNSKCGCFYCLETFDGAEIRQWTDEGITALCPRCGIDSVLSEYQHEDISTQGLKARHHRSFGA
jgi:hypothetical protein